MLNIGEHDLNEAHQNQEQEVELKEHTEDDETYDEGTEEEFTEVEETDDDDDEDEIEERLRKMMGQIKIKQEHNLSPSDTVLISGKDNAKFNCHRENLIARSDYFAAMFSGAMVESTASEVTLCGIRKDILSLIVLYSYTGEIHIEGDIVVELMRTAAMLQFPDIVAECTDYRITQLTPANCLCVAFDANQYNLETLHTAATQYALKHFQMVVRERVEFLQIDFGQLAQLIASDDLGVYCEQEVFENVMLWVQHDPCERSKHVPELMALIRLPYIPRVYLNARVQRVCEAAKCEELMESALSPPSRSLLPLAAPHVPCRNYRHNKFLTVSVAFKKIVIEFFSPETGVWTHLHEMNVYNEYFSAALVHNQLVIAGNRPEGRYGQDYRNMPLDQVVQRNPAVARFPHQQPNLEPSIFDPREFVFEEIVQIMNLNTRKMTVLKRDRKFYLFFSTGVLRGKVYIIGGEEDATDYATVERFDPDEQTWTDVAPMLHARSNVSVVVLNDRMYALAGTKWMLSDDLEEGGGIISLTLNESYAPDTNTWTRRSSMKHTSCHSVVTATDKYIYAFGTTSYVDRGSLERYDPIVNSWNTIHSFHWTVPGVCGALNGSLYALALPNIFSQREKPSFTVHKYDHVRSVWAQSHHSISPAQESIRFIFPVSDIFNY